MMFKENDQLDQGILLNPSSQQVFNVEIFLYELQRVSQCVSSGAVISVTPYCSSWYLQRL